MVESAVAVGVLLNLLLYEGVGLTAGGMVVPGYLALFLDQPLRVAATLLLAVVTWLVVARGLGRMTILFGRRRYGAMLVVGILGTWALARLAPHVAVAGADVRAIGYIVPGLLANEMERQGVLTTLAATAALAVITRLILLLFTGWGL
ncbi:poly-gamma-glutamate biosynthesis protein PgsC [Limnochorda pilosa]|uniref:Capsule biosynthesis protein CapC n=1 Tax=Limnochorda pilosa TaxID=1555112 RepID=A0A0K2SGR0_LIMPI|nr:poly-gamma-glutamate biosynthesis protein PgsC [Limnochorda pilosa]BAS26298.1 capsule biosynthesis protein CapC [Limnochorda pilosa]